MGLGCGFGGGGGGARGFLQKAIDRNSGEGMHLLPKLARRATTQEIEVQIVVVRGVSSKQEMVLHGGICHKDQVSMPVGTSGCTQWLGSLNELFSLLVPSYRVTIIVLGESGTLVPLVKSAASAPWRPSPASASMLHTKSFPRAMQFGGCSQLLWEI